MAMSKTQARATVEESVAIVLSELSRGRWRGVESGLRTALQAAHATQRRGVLITVVKGGLPADPRLSNSAQRVVRILELFTDKRPLWGVANVAAALEMERSTTHRYLASLVAVGQLRQQTKGTKYMRTEVAAGRPHAELVRLILEDMVPAMSDPDDVAWAGIWAMVVSEAERLAEAAS